MRVLLVMTDGDFYAHTGYAQAWTAALRERGCVVDRLARIPHEWATSGPPAGRWDLVVDHVLVEEVVAEAHTLRLSALLEAAGAPLLNPLPSVVASADKLVTHAVWAAAGLPQPRTWDLGDAGAWPAPGEPLVLKPALGDGARHLELVESLEDAHRAVRRWRADEAQGGERRGAALLQAWVREPRVVRLYATPDRVSLAHGKARAPGALVTHGTTYPHVFAPSAAMAELARDMVATLGGGLMGVDVLVGDDGRLWALEANVPFGFDVTDPAQGRWIAEAALSRVPAPV